MTGLGAGIGQEDMVLVFVVMDQLLFCGLPSDFVGAPQLLPVKAVLRRSQYQKATEQERAPFQFGHISRSVHCIQG